VSAARGLAAAAALVVAAACSGDDGEGGSGSDGGGDTTIECPEGLPGPEMVAVPSLGGTEYCIDATEVTSIQYQEFLFAAPDVEQPERCDENATFEPLAEVQCEGAYDPVARPDHPVSCVDWCDAWAFCEWSGKHLCGRIGGGPLGADDADLNDASASEWYSACSGMGENDYTYGDTYEIETCNAGPDTYEYDVPPEPVGSFADCHGTRAPFDRLFDMSGNVGEWIDACEDGVGVAPYCWEASGGSNSRSLSSCNASLYVSWDDSWWHKGFRCCY
jgi:formylglycine-generating enzyme